MNQKNSNKRIKWFDGRMVQGAYRQWLVDEHPEALEFSVLDIIARYTLGYKKRYAYIKQEKFIKSQPSTWRQVKKAEELGLLEYKRTHGLTMYKLVLPIEIEENTLWMKESTVHTQEEKKTNIDTGGW